MVPIAFEYSQGLGGSMQVIDVPQQWCDNKL